MPEIDSLTVRIEADLTDLRRGLREAERLVAKPLTRCALYR